MPDLVPCCAVPKCTAPMAARIGKIRLCAHHFDIAKAQARGAVQGVAAAALAQLERRSPGAIQLLRTVGAYLTPPPVVEEPPEEIVIEAEVISS